MGKVLGVSLFGDPLFLPLQPIVRDFTRQSLRFGSATLVDPTFVDVPKNLRSVTGSYCFPNDPVCQTFTFKGLNTLALADCMAAINTGVGVCPHMQYVDNGETAKAAAFLEPNLPSKTVWPTLTLSTPAQGQVGVAYSWAVPIKPQTTAKIRYTWTVPNLEAMPPGLKLDETTGVLSGTPTTAGNYSFQIQAITPQGAIPPQGRYVSGTVTIIVKLDSSHVRSISAGFFRTCALTTRSAVKCWGDTAFGTPADGTTTNSTTPVDAVGLGSGVAAVSVGYLDSCALTTRGAVKCWGDNSQGSLGDGTTTNSTTPVGVVGLGSGVAAVSVGGSHSCAVTTRGAVKCWGDNKNGALGNGTTISSTTPVNVVGLGSGVARVSAGPSHTCAVTTRGAVKCWGVNANGELGSGTAGGSSTPKSVVGLGSGVAEVSAGLSQSCAVTTRGAVKCWGFNGFGELGNGTANGATSRVLVGVVGVVGLGSGVTAVSAGDYHTCAVTTGGAAKCWGKNVSGQLGDGLTTDSASPVNVIGMP